MSSDERVRFLGHLRLVSAARSFIDPVIQAGDLRGAWGFVDPVLRLCLAQKWLYDNQADVTAGGFDPDQVIQAFGEEEPNHELWDHFERVYTRSMRQLLPLPDALGIGANTRLVAPDIESLYVHDITNAPGDVWQPGEARNIYPVLMRWDGERWLVLNLGSEAEPRPGRPPTFL